MFVFVFVSCLRAHACVCLYGYSEEILSNGVGFGCVFGKQMTKQNYAESLPVLMPGDEVPKFIALACPCQPPKEERITIHVQKEAPSDFCSGT